LKKNNLTFDERLLLAEIGLLQANTNTGLIFDKRQYDDDSFFLYGKYAIKVTKKANSPKQMIDFFVLTKAGEELQNLINPEITVGHIRDFCIVMEKQHFKVEYSIIKNSIDDSIGHTLSWIPFDRNDFGKKDIAKKEDTQFL
jgi:arginyl-tRNA--protein-N-Asp/Glu arginylyltransferase